jgi:hypothetical protein
MNRDDIIRLAREADFNISETFGPLAGPYPIYKELEHFAALVAAAEREACAKVCDDLWQEDKTAYDCREAIRARGHE